MITHFSAPSDLRIDSWVESGTTVSPFYDPMIAKFIATGPTREAAIEKLRAGLRSADISGIETNADYCFAALGLPEFAAGTMTTRSLNSFAYQPRSIAVLDGGALSSLQSLPGRLGFWEVGIPPSGPMDDKSFAAANALLGNAPGTTALELTLTGPTLKFACDTEIALTGAAMEATLDGTPIAHNARVPVKAGQILMLGGHRGCRPAQLPRDCGRFCGAGISRLDRDLHAGRFRRPYRRRVARGGHAAPGRCAHLRADRAGLRRADA